MSHILGKLQIERGILPVLLLLLLGCNKPEAFQSYLSYDTLYLDTDTLLTGQALDYELYVSGSDTFFVAGDHVNNAIHFYSLTTQKRIRSVFYERDGPDFVPGIVSFQVVDDSTILVQANPYIVITDYQGTVLKRYNVASGDQIKNYDPGKGQLINDSPYQSYEPSKNWYYMVQRSTDHLNDVRVTITAIDLQQDTLYHFDLPEILFLKTHTQRTNIGVTALSDSFIFNIRGLSDVFLFKEGELHRFDQVDSRFTINEIAPSQAGMSFNEFYYSINFSPVYYDSAGSDYYAVHYSGEETPDGITFTNYLRVINENFELINEFEIGQKLFPKPAHLGNAVYFLLWKPKSENPFPLVRVTYHKNDRAP